MSRYGDNCDAHDLPVRGCVYYVREALDKSVAEIDRLKGELEEANKRIEVLTQSIGVCGVLQAQLSEAKEELFRYKQGLEVEDGQ